MIKAIAIDDEPMALKIIESHARNFDFIDLQFCTSRTSSIIEYAKREKVDLIFCDIQMPEMTGLELVKKIPADIMIIFTTAHANYAAASYELNAIDYLLKPINLERFTQAITKAKQFIQFKNQTHPSTLEGYIFVRADYSVMKISLQEILHIQGLADYSIIHLKEKKRVITRLTLKEMTEKLPMQHFIRIHRSTILPIHRIEKVKGHNVYIQENEFKIGRTYVEDFFKQFSNHSSLSK